MHYVYILYSSKLNRFYTGQTHDVSSRLERHNSGYYQDKWSDKGKPWSLYLTISCRDKKQALAIEAHIKKMKSRKYIQNLKSYPQIIECLKKKYAPAADG